VTAGDEQAIARARAWPTNEGSRHQVLTGRRRSVFAVASIARMTTRQPDFLQGGGEMGALMRAHDWSRSSLGRPADWPQSLRTVVRLMLNTGHPMYIWWGPELACLYNDAYRESIGPERHPGSLGLPAREVWGEIWPIIGPQIEQVTSGLGATWHVDQLVPITRHGRLDDVYWTYSYSPIDDDAAPGGIGGVLVVCTETTKQVLAARQLASERDRLAQLFAAMREGEARFRAALKAGRMGHWETDLVTRTRTWSDEAMALFGFSLRDGKGRVGGSDDEYAAALHPEDRHLAAHYLELAEQHDSYAAEYRVVRPDGSMLWLAGRGAVTARGADGAPLRIVSVMADVTETRQAEQMLRVERERLRLALSAGQMGAYELDIERDSLWWSPETYQLFGVDPRTFTPTRESVIDLLDPEDRPGFAKRRRKAIAERQPFFDEFRILRPDGSRIWIGYRGQAEYDEQGRPVRTFGVVMDISERKHAEQVLRDADREKDDFIATLSHELRNPVAPIRNAVNVLRQLPTTDPRAAWCQDVIARQTEQMAHLLDDLLDVSRLTRGRLTLRTERLDLATVIEHAIEIAQPLIEAAGHELLVDVPAGTLQLEGDLTRLAQVFSNILINSAKYTPPRGTIAITAAADGDALVVKVNDTGIGIADEHIGQIFDMFGQVDAASPRSRDGQGIGLSLARRLVELHGGTIEARSDGVGKGSEFEIRLPSAARASDDEPVLDAARSAGTRHESGFMER
jgi:PAS domain S-box-containing protein